MISTVQSTGQDFIGQDFTGQGRAGQGRAEERTLALPLALHAGSGRRRRRRRAFHWEEKSGQQTQLGVGISKDSAVAPSVASFLPSPPRPCNVIHSSFSLCSSSILAYIVFILFV